MKYEIMEAGTKNVDQVVSMCIGCLASNDPIFDTDVPSEETVCGGCVSGCSLVACLEGKVLGWAGLKRVEGAAGKNAAQASVFIDPGYRGKGIGKSLLEELIRRSRAAGVESISADIYSKNIAGMMLYKNAGFKATGVKRGAGMVEGKRGDAVLLVYKV